MLVSQACQGGCRYFVVIYMRKTQKKLITQRQATEQLQITERHLRRMREKARKGYRQQAMDALAWVQNARL